MLPRIAFTIKLLKFWRLIILWHPHEADSLSIWLGIGNGRMTSASHLILNGALDELLQLARGDRPI